MRSGDIHAVIRWLEERLDQLYDEKGRTFIKQMAARLDKQGDAFHCTWKQGAYVYALFSRLGGPEQCFPKRSKLDELKAKRASILSRSRRRHKIAAHGREMEARSFTLVLKEIGSSPVEAKMRHSDSLKRQLTGNRILIRGTKR